MEGYVNVDMFDHPDVNIVYDLNIMPWPFEDDSIEEVFMAQCLEHLVDHNAAMKEIYRILKPGGARTDQRAAFYLAVGLRRPDAPPFFRLSDLLLLCRTRGLFRF